MLGPRAPGPPGRPAPTSTPTLLLLIQPGPSGRRQPRKALPFGTTLELSTASPQKRIAARHRAPAGAPPALALCGARRQESTSLYRAAQLPSYRRESFSRRWHLGLPRYTRREERECLHAGLRNTSSLREKLKQHLREKGAWQSEGSGNARRPSDDTNGSPLETGGCAQGWGARRRLSEAGTRHAAGRGRARGLRAGPRLRPLPGACRWRLRKGS